MGHVLDPRTWHWDTLALLGFCGQALFASRFIIQWIASERKKRSHIPVPFWWLSLFGGAIVTIYGLLRRDPVAEQAVSRTRSSKNASAETR